MLKLKPLIWVICLVLTFIFENAKANSNCKFEINGIMASPESIFSASLLFRIRIFDLDTNEHIQDISFKGKMTSQLTFPDTHNCYDQNKQDVPIDLKLIPIANGLLTGPNEYLFKFDIMNTKVISQKYCPSSYQFFEGSFIVQTNKNSYWLDSITNPQGDIGIDFITYDFVKNLGGKYKMHSVDQPELHFIKKAKCH